ncbi:MULTISPECIES: hypothetical protein [unclassified Pseudoalteromonas]|uniref:hypothetical protein n=1 Tax=unclassified Pseudoalteromonas TaxID=194690 RepID=UPI0011111A5C|nr:MULTISPECIES: hypothetical protein [unclassified Pseudoalteromonas]
MKNLIGMSFSDTTVSGSFKYICQIGEKSRQKNAEVVYAIGGSSIMRSSNEKHIASKELLVKEYYSLLAKSNFYHSFLNG